MSVGTNIKQLRLKKDMTQQELADRLGLTQNNVTRWERDGDNGKCYYGEANRQYLRLYNRGPTCLTYFNYIEEKRN